MRVRWIRAVAALEILGSAVGLWLGIRVVPALWNSAPASAVAYVAVFVFTGAAGIFLWSGKPQGRSMSIATQALQVFSLSINGWYYQFFAGLIAGAIYNTGQLNLMAGPGAAFLIAAGHGPSGVSLGVNAVPIAALAILAHTRREIPSERSA